MDAIHDHLDDARVMLSAIVNKSRSVLTLFTYGTSNDIYVSYTAHSARGIDKVLIRLLQPSSM